MKRTFSSALTSMPLGSIGTALQIARSETLSTIRLARFKLLALVLSATVLFAYALSCSVYFSVAPYNPSFIGGTPPYLLGNLDPAYFFFYQAGILLLVFDHRHRLQRNRLLEVIESQPVMNWQLQLGQTLCYSGLIWAVIVVNVFLMQCMGLVAQIFRFDFADTIQLHSVFNLLVVDAPVALLFWTSLFLLLTHVLRSRLLVLVSSIVVMYAYYLWVVNTPFAFVDLLSHSSNQTLFISEILPALPSLTSWIMRVGVLLLAVALLAFGAWWYQRTDSVNKVWSRALPWTTLAVSAFVLGSGVLYETSQANKLRSWRAAHLNYEWNAKLDIQAIRGGVVINPSKHLRLDVDVDFTLMSESPVQMLVFTLNPGYRITSIHLNETACEFEFDRGILEVSVPFAVEPETEYSLQIEATGKPNPYFAYLNTPYDYMNDADFPIQALHSFGTDGSIYNRQFVALMPGAYWYPIPGPVPPAADDNSFRGDFFDVELQVQLDAPPAWKVVGPGTTQPDSSEPSKYQIKPNIPIASIGLFASEFVKVSHDFQHIELALYLHARHAHQVGSLGDHGDNILKKIQTFMTKLNDEENSTPFESVAFVEVPNRLRTVGAGWNMDRWNSLPGIILLKEQGYPTMNIKRMVKDVEQAYEGRENIFNWVWIGLRYTSERALANDNLFDAFHDQSWKHIVSVSGEHQKALDLFFRALSRTSNDVETSELFSIYATAQTARLTGLNLPSAWGIGRSRDSGIFEKETLADWEARYKERPAIWDKMERTALPSLTFEGENFQQNFEILLLKSEKIANAFNIYPLYIEKQSLNRWLVSLRGDFAGQHFNYDDAMMHARDSDVDIEFLLDDWLVNDTLAGFEISRGTMIRIAPSEEGNPRYLFSFDIANTQPTAGIVNSRSGAFALSGNSSKRVTHTLESLSGDIKTWIFDIGTGLSLNRTRLGFVVSTENVQVDESLLPIESIEDSNFVPEWEGIVVDDLDTGFQVDQPESVHVPFRFTPRDWFIRNLALDIFDGTLPDIGSTGTVPQSLWVRRTEPNAFGQYRRTTAMSKVGRSMKLRPVRFVAEVPHTDRWSLDFYVHQPYSSWGLRAYENFNIEVKNGSSTWTKDFKPDTGLKAIGWQTIGEFDLIAGQTDVVVVGTVKPSVVFADAIRWRRLVTED